MPLSDALVLGPESLYCAWGSNARVLVSLKLALTIFPWLGVPNRRLIAADTLTAGCFRSSWCRSHWTLVPTPWSRPCTWCFCFEVEGKYINDNFFLFQRYANQMLSGLADWLKILNTKDEIYRVKKRNPHRLNLLHKKPLISLFS